jgi:Tetracyclin repressor-like, C-terminal domain
MMANLVVPLARSDLRAALLTEAHTDPVHAAEYRHRVVEPRPDQARAGFHRAIAHGEIPAGTNIEVALDLLSTARSITGCCTATRP